VTFKTHWFSNKISSSEGFWVRSHGRSEIEYADAIGHIFVSAEILAARLSFALYPDDMRIDSRDGCQLKDEQRRRLVASRIKSAFEFIDARIDIN